MAHSVVMVLPPTVGRHGSLCCAWLTLFAITTYSLSLLAIVSMSWVTGSGQPPTYWLHVTILCWTLGPTSRHRETWSMSRAWLLSPLVSIATTYTFCVLTTTDRTPFVVTTLRLVGGRRSTWLYHNSC